MHAQETAPFPVNSIYQAYVDESGGSRAGRILLLAACILDSSAWSEFSNDWQEALQAHPTIGYFHTREARNRQGNFARWKSIDVDRKLIALTEVILRHKPHVFVCWVSQDDHAETVEAHGVPDVRNAYFTCFMATVYKIAEYQMRRGITTAPDFVFDEKGGLGEEALLWYPFIKATARPDIRKMMGDSPVFRRDEQVHPLQAADLIAWHKRRQKEFGIRDPEIAATMRINELPGAETHITREALDLMTKRMLTIPGLAEARKHPSYYKQFKQDRRKALRRAATGSKGEVNPDLDLFNSAMDAILKPNPADVDSATGAEKRK